MSDIHNASPRFILFVNDKLLDPAMFMLSFPDYTSKKGH
jgi:hypothetical protein